MPKLNQIVAIATGRKSQVDSEKTRIYHEIQKRELFDGLSRKYHPSDESGEELPPEQKLITLSAGDCGDAFCAALSSLWDIVATQDRANTEAVADVVVGDKKLLIDVPVTTLIFLEKQMEDVRTFISHLPVLRPEYKWEWDDGVNCYSTPEERTNRTKKVPRVIVKYEATEHHPAQTEMFTDDVKVGEWAVIRFSGAVPAKRKKEMLAKVNILKDAIKLAREEANNIEANQVAVAKPLLDFIFD